MKAPITSAQAMQHPTVVVTINTLSQLAERLRTENEVLRQQLEQAQQDVARYQWLKDQYLAVDTSWQGSGMQVLIFESPSTTFSADLDATLDAAMEASK